CNPSSEVAKLAPSGAKTSALREATLVTVRILNPSDTRHQVRIVPEALTRVCPSLEKRTAFTPDVLAKVRIRLPSETCQSFTSPLVVSVPPDARSVESGEKSTANEPPGCPARVRSRAPSELRQILMEGSSVSGGGEPAAVAVSASSAERATALMTSPCPTR